MAKLQPAAGHLGMTLPLHGSMMHALAEIKLSRVIHQQLPILFQSMVLVMYGNDNLLDADIAHV